MKDLLAQTRHLFETAEGIPEPAYHPDGAITNWPQQFEAEFHQVVRAISETANSEGLSRVAIWYESFQNPRVPQTLFQIISRCLYDNPNLEMHSS